MPSEPLVTSVGDASGSVPNPVTLEQLLLCTPCETMTFDQEHAGSSKCFYALQHVKFRRGFQSNNALWVLKH